MTQRVSVRVGEQEIVLETGKLAKQANGAVIGSFGGSAVLATVCCSSNETEGLDFVPLQVEYNEKYYAAGKIPGGFLKREGRPKDKEILVCRLIDRPMRPLFSKAFGREIQVVPTTISTDQVNPPDILAMNAASAAVVISDIPFDGPVGAVRVASLDGELIINPTFEQIEKAQLDIIVSGTMDGITMVEGGAYEVPEELLLSAIEAALNPIQDLCRAQLELRELAGKEKLPLKTEKPKLPQEDEIRAKVQPLLEEACFIEGKHNRSDAIKKIKEDAREGYEFDEFQEKLFYTLLHDIESDIVRKSILKNGKRTDGRSVTDIRKVSCEVDLLPRTHGSALFTRGETQALAVTTLGTVFDEQMIDDIDGEKRYSNFMLHYNFPPYSVGETGRLGTGRREIGHGHLAQRAIEGVLPEKGSFPYTIRVVSEILESNGSSSMATVCGGALSLLNAGVPLKKPVAGIAMGLISEGDDFVVLSDILGEEDHLGDMDFKVAGTEEGITAFQMDIKISGVSSDIMKKALEQAKQGRLHILGIMNKTLDKPSAEVSKYAPKVVNYKVDPDKIGAIIGPGGKNIKGISEKSGANVNIEDSGIVTIYGKNHESSDKALELIKALIEEPEVGKVYEGTVKRIVEFGAFVEFLPGKEGLVHISKLSRERINAVKDVLEMDQEIPVKIIEIDRMGRINLSYIDAIDPDGASKDQGSRDRGRRNEGRRDHRGSDHRSRDHRGGDRGGERGGERNEERGGDREKQE
jgi:polyribonucleotide nucleotidyltransferase